MMRPMALESLDQTQRHYLAPEAHAALTPASDYFLLGVLLYQLLFDSLPFDTGAPGLLRPDAFKGKHRDLEPSFRQLLEPDAGYRIQSLDQINTALQQCAIVLPEPASGPAKTSQGQRYALSGAE
jgi:serine/threonine protein kinase